jgi:DNA polymerase IIIc chi subunit
MNKPARNNKASAMYTVAEAGLWKFVSPDFVTEETAFLEDQDKRTPIHYVAMAGKLREVPRQLLTQQSLTQPN